MHKVKQNRSKTEEGKKKMIIKMTGLYGLENSDAYYRKLGLCFDFVNSVEHASELTADEVAKVTRHKEWYLKQYNAKDLEIIATK